MYGIAYMWDLQRNDTNELTKQRLTDLESQLVILGGWVGGLGEGIVGEFGMDMYTLLCVNWIADKLLLYGTWNSAQ